MSQEYIDEIEGQIVPKYRNYYVAYKQLSDSISVLREREEGADTSAGAMLKGLMLPKDFTFGDTTAIYGMVEQRPEVRFVSLLQHEVSKLNHFTSLEVKTMLTTLRQLDKKLLRTLAGEDLVLSRRVFPSATDEVELAMSPDQKLRAIYDRLVVLCDEMLVIENYVRVNIQILKRVIGEFDTAFSDRSAPIGNWFVPNLANEPFANMPFGGLFTITSRLFSQCSQTTISDGPVDKVLSVPKQALLRIKLLMGTVSGLEKPDRISDQLWARLGVPLRSEELSHESVQSTSNVTVALFPDTHSCASLTVVESSCWLATHDGGKTEASASHIAELGQVENVHIITFQETKFKHAKILESIRIRTGVFDFTAFGESLDVEAGFITAGRRQSVGSMDATQRRLSSSVLYCSRSVPLDRLSEFTTKLPDSFSFQDFEELESSESAADLTSATPPFMPMPSPLLSHPPVPTIPPLAHSASPQPATSLIYPKNFMANERSFLAWVSAIAVQAGIGLALLGKPGKSFAGSIVCLVALGFLWWSVYVFVKRFRQLKSPKPENANVFYSMELPTVFGVTQLVILMVQTLIFLW